ncbi:MAG: uracil-DNA glycosylase [Erysipelotrichaceae bacterium]|jgi:uracil-DNA glycosylase|nr:uracil-DNA glycosylase [Erysipelotrichaceae bacterium]MCR5095428.1 uracil-DNA glycosylase [Erysipelotrichaceae bacterium]
MKIIGNDWDDVLGEEFDKEYYQQLRRFLDAEYKSKTIYPLPQFIYTALKLTPYKDTKVVILGQDPYHEPNQAHGLAFSVNKGVMVPPSLQNIYKELHDDLGCSIPNHGFLISWAKQGVLLLNTVLTVQAHRANSHRGQGWEELTDTIIRKINAKDEPVVFILWGSNARSKKAFITNKKHLILESVHPSPLSAYNGFFGSRPFSKTNNFLIANGEDPIDWQIR